MIFHVHGQPLVGSIEGRAFRNSPGLEHAFHFQTKVVVQMGSSVLLNYKPESLFGIELGRGLGGVIKATFAFVFFKGHRFSQQPESYYAETSSSSSNGRLCHSLNPKRAIPRKQIPPAKSMTTSQSVPVRERSKL